MALRDLIIKTAPPWLKRTWGARFIYTFGVMADGVLDWSFGGVKARFPSFAPPDALPAIGRDRVIMRGFDEPDATYALRLRRAFDSHQLQGNPFELLREIRAYLYPFDVRCRLVDNRGTWTTIDVGGAESIDRVAANWDWDGHAPPAWSRFWVIIYPSTSGLWSAAASGSGHSVWGTGNTIGTTATPAQVHSIREICRAWRPEGTRLMNIIVAFDDASFDPAHAPGAPLPDGTWGTWGKYVGGVKRPARLATARYWDGIGNVDSYTGG